MVSAPLAPPPAPAAGSIEATAARLATLLTGSATTMSDAGGRGDLEFEPIIGLRRLDRTAPPADVWAIDGGQITVVDARCLAVMAVRASRVRFQRGACVIEEEGPIRVHILGAHEHTAARDSLGLPDVLADDCKVDGNLVRDRWEWDGVERAIDEAEPGAMVLVDGDLQPDWRIPSSFVARLLERAAERDVVLAAITKHSSLARGGAPLLGQLELEAAALFGERSTWWAPVGRVRGDIGPDGLQVVAARLDADAPFAFRIDLPGNVDAQAALASLSALCDDAAFPGYPYPLTVADRIAACPGWLAAEVRMQLDDLLDRAGVPHQVRERAFADRHSMMERA